MIGKFDEKIVKDISRGKIFRLNPENVKKLKASFQNSEGLSAFLSLVLLYSETVDLHIKIYKSTSSNSEQSFDYRMENDPFVRNVAQVCFLHNGKRLIEEGMNDTQKVLTVMRYMKSLEDTKDSKGAYVELLLSVAVLPPLLAKKVHSSNVRKAFSYLVHCGYDINRKNGIDNNTALYHAAASNNSVVVEELLKYPSVVLDCKNPSGIASLSVAILGYNLLYRGIESTRLLAEAESERNNTDILVVVQNRLNELRRSNGILSRIITLNLSAEYIVSKFVYKHNGVSLYSAIKDNNIEVVKELLKHPYLDHNMVQNLYTPLGLAIAYDRVEIAEMLLAHPKLDPCIPCSVDNVGKSKSNKTNLEYAAFNGEPRIVNALLKHPKVIAREMKSVGRALLRAVNSNSTYKNQYVEKAVGVIKALIECPKGQISQAEYFKAFSEICSSAQYYPEIIKVFIHNPKFDINFKNKRGDTPLHSAVSTYSSYDTIALCKEFVKREDIDLSIKDEEGKTPLRLAIERERGEVIQLLVEFQSRKCNTDVRTLLSTELGQQVTVKRVGWWGSKEVKLPAVDKTPEQIIADFKYSDAEINVILAQITKTESHSISK